MSPSIQSVLSRDVQLIARTLALGLSEARIEVQILLQSILSVSRAYLIAHGERLLTEQEHAAYQKLLQRRMAGEPVAYILGEREFFGLNFKVTSATLIPRPDTELLVELALQHATKADESAIPLRDSQLEQSRRTVLPDEAGLFSLLDLGTGSGAIAISIASSAPCVKVMACDLSWDALKVAEANAARLGVRNVQFVQSDWFSAIPQQKFSMIVSNPPYIEAEDSHLRQGDVRFEPITALVSGSDGLKDIRHIVQNARHYLMQGGWLLLEHGYDQAERVQKLLADAGYEQIFSARDLGGNERVTGGCLPVQA